MQAMRTVPFAFAFLIGLGMLGYGIYGFQGRKIYGYVPINYEKSYYKIDLDNSLWVDYWFGEIPELAENVVFSAKFQGWGDYYVHLPENQRVLVKVEKYPFRVHENEGQLLENWTVENVQLKYFFERTWLIFDQRRSWNLPLENGTLKFTIVEPARVTENDKFPIPLIEESASIVYLENIELRGFLRDKAGRSVKNVTIGVFLDNTLIASGFFSAEYYLVLPPNENLRIVAWASGYKTLEQKIETGTEDMWVNLVFSGELPVSTEMAFTAGGLLLMGTSAIGLVWTRRTL